jgi:hypothetical protein
VQLTVAEADGVTAKPKTAKADEVFSKPKAKAAVVVEYEDDEEVEPAKPAKPAKGNVWEDGDDEDEEPKPEPVKRAVKKPATKPTGDLGSLVDAWTDEED